MRLVNALCWLVEVAARQARTAGGLEAQSEAPAAGPPRAERFEALQLGLE
jgi:hypothetical protein